MCLSVVEYPFLFFMGAESADLVGLRIKLHQMNSAKLVFKSISLLDHFHIKVHFIFHSYRN